MVVITLTDTPPKVRGDLSKWLLEINTGVYVGNISTRVREELWERICTNLKTGRATMVYSTNGEQKMDFKVHNSTWQPVDFDGLKLMRHPVSTGVSASEESLTKKGFSNASKREYARRKKTNVTPKEEIDEYSVIDIETTGLSFDEDSVIEVAALLVQNGNVTEEFNQLISYDGILPEETTRLTGISKELLEKDGRPLQEVFEEFLSFLKTKKIVFYNASFDLGFIQMTCQKLGLDMPEKIQVIDAMKLSRKKIKNVQDYKLTTVGQSLGMDISGAHRALKDCYLTFELYEKLNEN